MARVTTSPGYPRQRGGTARVEGRSETLGDRIDALPLSRAVWQILLLAGIAWLIESYDIGVIGNVLPILKQRYALGSAAVGILVASSTLGIVTALLPGGRIADRVGRKPVLVAGTAWYAVFTLLTGFATDPHGIIALRFVAGLGMGAIFPIPYILAAELTPARFRGALAGVLDAFLSVGYFIAPLLAAVIVPRLPVDVGWRWLFFLGGLPLLYIPALLRWMPESPRWLAARGRTEDAERIVAGMEATAGRDRERPAPRTASPETGRDVDVSATDIFRGGYRRRTAMLWIAFPSLLFVFYAVQTYTPTVLVRQGYSLDNAFLLTALIVVISIPGKIAEAFAVERYGRKATIVWFGAVAAAAALVFGFSHSTVLTVLAGALLAFFGVGVDPAIKMYSAEQYPTVIRETGVGLAEGMARLFGGALAPFIMALILGAGGMAGSYIFVAAVALTGVAAVGVLGTETRGRRLETVAAASIRQPRAEPMPEIETA